MLQVLFYNGIDAFLSWSASPTLRFIIIMEGIFIVLGVLLGLLAKPKRWLTIALASLAGIGLLAVLKSNIIGVSSDAYIAFPFIGEAVFVGAALVLIIFALKRTRA